MKMEYEKPELEIWSFTEEFVITLVSGGDGPGMGDDWENAGNEGL